jgi:hypothetical protein
MRSWIGYGDSMAISNDVRDDTKASTCSSRNLK